MLKDFFSKAGIAKLLSKVRIGGVTVDEHLKLSRLNTVTGLKSLFKRAVMSDTPVDTFMGQLSKSIKTRKRHTLTTLRNVFSSVRGQARALAVIGQSGTWHNNGILDSKTTSICTNYMYSSWDMPYSQIPDRPPRVAVTPHPCRSFLTFVKKGDAPPKKTTFMAEFNDSEDLQKELLGPTRFEAYKAGALKIDSFVDYERSVLNTLDDLGIK